MQSLLAAIPKSQPTHRLHPTSLPVFGSLHNLSVDDQANLNLTLFLHLFQFLGGFMEELVLESHPALIRQPSGLVVDVYPFFLV
jgi:hypothetical protein